MVGTRIEKGSVLVYRVFDIADEVDLPKVLKILGDFGSESRFDLSTRNRNAVIVKSPPVRFGLGEVDIQIEGGPRKADVTATIWDYGAVSFAFQIPINPGTTWTELISLAALLNADSSTVSSLDARGFQKRDEVLTLLKPALKSPTQWPTFEDYIIYFIERVDGAAHNVTLLDQFDISALILGEVRDELASATRASLLENLYQYAENDFVLIDWNAALVLEPTGQRETIDILEFALTQLLEVRYYDDLLDRRLTVVYDSIEEGRRRFFMRQFGDIAREANTRFIEISEFIERMSNSLKVVGDFYLARIYRGALKRFRIQDWQESITRKMNGLARVSELLHGEANVRRSHMLELIVIILILFELISTLVRH